MSLISVNKATEALPDTYQPVILWSFLDGDYLVICFDIEICNDLAQDDIFFFLFY